MTKTPTPASPNLHPSRPTPPTSEADLLKRGLVWVAEGGSVVVPPHVAPATLRPQLSTTNQALATLFPPDGIKPGTTHEFILAGSTSHNSAPFLPATLPTFFASTLLQAAPGKTALWIGREAWPAPFLLEQLTGELFDRCIFINPSTEQELLWAVDTALRSPAVAVVVTTIKKLSLPLTRRFAMSARQSGATAFFLGHKQTRLPLATHSAWTMTPKPSATHSACWSLELLRMKGVQPSQSVWTIDVNTEVNDETVSLALSPSLADRPVSRQTGQKAA